MSTEKEVNKVSEENKEIEGQFTFDGDTKRKHRFVVRVKEITGVLYVPKDCHCIPEKIILFYSKAA